MRRGREAEGVREEWLDMPKLMGVVMREATTGGWHMITAVVSNGYKNAVREDKTAL